MNSVISLCLPKGPAEHLAGKSGKQNGNPKVLPKYTPSYLTGMESRASPFFLLFSYLVCFARLGGQPEWSARLDGLQRDQRRDLPLQERVQPFDTHLIGFVGVCGR